MNLELLIADCIARLKAVEKGTKALKMGDAPLKEESLTALADIKRDLEALLEKLADDGQGKLPWSDEPNDED